MGAKAIFTRKPELVTLLALAFAANSGDIIQLADGRAGVIEGLKPSIIGDDNVAAIEGHYDVTKAANINILKGGKVYWDRTNNVATFKRVTGGFYIGVALKDALPSDATVAIDLNVEPKYRVNSLDQNFTTALVGAATAVRDACGSRTTLAVIATNEAEKSDALSDQVVAIADGPIFEASFTLVANGSTSAVNVAFGLASGTHATTITSITSYALFEVTGASLELNAMSTDGTTTVAATDTTVAAVVGTYNELWIDSRDPTNVKFYIDGIQVLTSTTFALAKAAGPMKALAYIVKTSSTATGSIAFEFCRIRSTDLS